MCKKTLPVENFALATKQGHRRGKCKPCQTEHVQRSKGTWEEYQKEKTKKPEATAQYDPQKLKTKKVVLCDDNELNRAYAQMIIGDKVDLTLLSSGQSST